MEIQPEIIYAAGVLWTVIVGGISKLYLDARSDRTDLIAENKRLVALLFRVIDNSNEKLPDDLVRQIDEMTR